MKRQFISGSLAESILAIGARRLWSESLRRLSALSDDLTPDEFAAARERILEEVEAEVSAEVHARLQACALADDDDTEPTR